MTVVGFINVFAESAGQVLMMGYSHALSGAVGWLAVAPLVSHALGVEPNLSVMVAGTVVTAGAALLPDLDHPDATIARTFGPISAATAKVVETLAGGHRNGTHSLLFAVLAGLSVEILALPGWSSITWVVVFALTAFAIRGLRLVPPTKSELVRTISVIVEAAVVTWILTLLPDITSWLWLGPAVFLGIILHCVGDSLTPQRVPWLYPKKSRYGIPLIAKTGNATENYVAFPLLGVAFLVLVWSVIISPATHLTAVLFI